jgi:hypothetical protein
MRTPELGVRQKERQGALSILAHGIIGGPPLPAFDVATNNKLGLTAEMIARQNAGGHSNSVAS